MLVVPLGAIVISVSPTSQWMQRSKVVGDWTWLGYDDDNRALINVTSDGCEECLSSWRSS